MSAGVCPRLHLGSLQRSPRYPSWFQGGRFAAGAEWRGEEERTRGGREEGKGGMGKGGEKRKLGIAPWLLGG